MIIHGGVHFLGWQHVPVMVRCLLSSGGICWDLCWRFDRGEQLMEEVLTDTACRYEEV